MCYDKETKEKKFQELGFKQLSVQVTPEIAPKVNLWITSNAKFLIKEEFGWRCQVFQAIPLNSDAWNKINGQNYKTFTKSGELEEFVKQFGII